MLRPARLRSRPNDPREVIDEFFLFDDEVGFFRSLILSRSRTLATLSIYASLSSSLPVKVIETGIVLA